MCPHLRDTDDSGCTDGDRYARNRRDGSRHRSGSSPRGASRSGGRDGAGDRSTTDHARRPDGERRTAGTDTRRNASERPSEEGHRRVTNRSSGRGNRGGGSPADRDRTGHTGPQVPDRRRTPTDRPRGGQKQDSSPRPDPQAGAVHHERGRHRTRGQGGGQDFGHRPGQEPSGPTPREQERTSPQRGNTQGHQGQFAHRRGSRERSQRGQRQRPGRNQAHGGRSLRREHGHRSADR